MIKDNALHYVNLRKEQNTYLGNYADFKIGGITDKMLSYDSSVKSVKANILASPFIIDLHQTQFANNKGIWTIKTTKEDLHQAIKDVEMSLEVLADVLLDRMFNKFDTYPKPRIVLEYGTSDSYTARVMSNMSTTNNNETENYSKPPPNAWSQGPPKMTGQRKSTSNKIPTIQ
eukprot:972582-Ditylum_brightwellii.AAC.1